MATKALIVVHGMGDHTEKTVLDEVTSAADGALSLYPSASGMSITSEVDIIAISYNDIFESYRQRVSAEAGGLAERLGRVGEQATPLAGTTAALNAIDARLGDDDMFETHWLDVILYRFTLLSTVIQLRVALEVANQVAELGSANVHILGHSLGTSVVHDSLSRLYSLPIETGDGSVVHPLHIGEHKLGGVHMVANVSRLLQHRFKVGVSTSLVRPGPNGCTSVFYEYRHKLDPFTRFRPFDPTDNGVWIDHESFDSLYRLVHDDLSAVTDVNVHALGHYLRNPVVHLPLFRQLFGFRPKKAERDAARQAYLTGTVAGKAEALQEVFGELNPADDNAIQAFLESGRALKDLVRSFGEVF